MRYETRVQTLCERRRKLQQTITLLGNFIDEINTESTHTTKYSCVNNIKLTHILLLSRDRAQHSLRPYPSHAFQKPRTNSDSTQTPRRIGTAQSRAVCRLLGLSRDKLSPLDLSRLFQNKFSFTVKLE